MKKTLACVAVAFCASGVAYAYFLNGAVKLGGNKKFYYLTTGTESVEACLVAVTKNGGAGFLMDETTGSEVALSVYFNGADAEKVYGANLVNYENLKISERESAVLYAKTYSDKKRAKNIQTDFENVYRHITTLNGILDELEGGGTQESVKRKLDALALSFQTLENSAIEELRPLCRRAKDGTAVLEHEIVTASDLRYLLCELCFSYAQAAGKFSL